MVSDEFLRNICSEDDWRQCKCGKYSGAATIEVLREAFMAHGIPVSCRDVFIEHIPIEIDLLIPKPSAKPLKYGILYKQEDVLAVIEVKNRGVIGEKGLAKLRRDFTFIKNNAPHIQCLYVCLSDRKTYKHRPIDDPAKDFRVFTLFFHTVKAKGLCRTSTGQYNELIETLRQIVCGHRPN